MALATVTLIGAWVTAAGAPAWGSITITPVAPVTGRGDIVTDTPLTVDLTPAGTITATVATTTGLSPTLQLRITEHLGGSPLTSYVITPTPGRVDNVTTTSGSATILDAAIGTGDAGLAVAGAGIPVPAYVGAVSPGVSFTLVDGAATPTPVTAPAATLTVGAIDLSTAPRGDAAAPLPLYVLAATLGQPRGPATLGPDGILTPAQRPPAGAGTVTDVTAADATIVIGGTPTVAPSVRVGTIAETQVANLTADLAGKLATATVTTKGDLVAATGVATLTRLGAGADGQVLTAASGQATGLQWATPGAKAHATTGLQTTVFPATGGAGTSGTWTACPAAYQVTVAADAGDVLEWAPSILAQVGSDAELDVASLVGGVPVNYYSAGYSSPQGAHGHGGLYMGANYSRTLRPIVWLVQTSDLTGGTITLALLYRAAGAGVTFGSTTYPAQVDVINFGP